MSNMIRTTLLMGGLTVLLVFVGGAIGGQTGALTAFIIAAGMNFVAYFFSDRMVLARYRAKEAGPDSEPRLYGIVEKLAKKADLPMPKVYVIPDRAPNAFATGRSPRHAAVAATRGILETLNDDELEGVMAHELAHVKHRDILSGTIAATLAGAVALVSRSAMYSGQSGQSNSNALGAMLAVIVAPLIAMILRMSVSRTREYAADDGGAEISGKPLGLASALEKISATARRRPLANLNSAHAHMFIVSPLSGGGLAGLMASHPPMEERVARLKAMAAGA
ncbi:MAG: zinc metalloprotease HtpX [Gammaproteobacteria bacterium]